MTRLPRTAPLAALAAALVLGACDRNGGDGNATAQASYALPDLPATVPMAAGPATPIATAPAASDLPDAKPLPLARVAAPDQAYGYADAAYSYEDALGDAPPDYAFDYDGVDPWAWQGYDSSLMVAEPIDEGYRYYYYRPGASEPYFIRDPWYSYGFAGGALAVVYGADGGIVPFADYGPRVGYASRYYGRGRALSAAAFRTRRRPVIAANWLRQRPVIVATRERWGAGRAHQPGWAAFHAANRPRQAKHWQEERIRRTADARRFADWRQSGFRAAAPARAIPPAWQTARWARDEKHYRPAAEARALARHERQEDRRRETDQRRDRRQEVAARRDREAARELRQADRNGAAVQERNAQAQTAARAQRQAERRQAAQAERLARRQPDEAGRSREQASEAARAARQAERQRAAQVERQQQRRQAGEAERARRQADRQQADQAERMQRQQAAQAERAQRRQAEQRQAEQARQAERQQARQQAQQQRQQIEQQQRQAARQQAQEQAQQQRQAMQQQQRQQMQAERAQAREQRQQQRQERRGPN